MLRILSFGVVLVVVLVSSMLALSGGAAAHERRNVGHYLFIVGWLNEPAYAGAANAATVRVSDARVDPAKPVVGLEKTLKIEVIQGGLAPYSGVLRAVFGQSGLYALDMYPTVAGQYRYRITGAVETTTVNETFESGPTTFNDVKSTTEVQYPMRVPSGDELGTRLDAIQSAAEQARGWAIAAFVLALFAFVSATNAYRLARRRP